MIPKDNRELRRTLLAVAFILASPALTAFAAWLVFIIWRGPWPRTLAAAQLDWLGWALMAALALIAIVLVGMSSSIGRRQITVDAGPVKFDASGEEGQS